MATRVEWYGDTFYERIKTGEKAALDELAKQMATEAQNRAPVATGALRDSIHANPATSAGSGYSVDVEADAPYALFVEVGTYKMAAQPFLRPAFDTYAPFLVEALRKYIE